MKRFVPASILGSLLGAAVVAIALWQQPSAAVCQDPPGCAPQRIRLDDHAYLRALSLDLRGVVPSPEEHEVARDGLSAEELDATLDAWLASEDFARRVVRRHRELLWPNISNVTRLYHFRRALSAPGGLWQQATRSTRTVYRGGDAGCLDEAATFDASGNVVTRDVDGIAREGWVMVRPYWDLSIEVRACAFDAQAQRISARGNDCSTRRAIEDPGCGCGPNLRWCAPNAVRDAVLRSFTESFERAVFDHVYVDPSDPTDTARPYHELFTSRTTELNGPLVTFWRHHRHSDNNVPLVPEALDVLGLPPTDVESAAVSAIGFAEIDRWIRVELPEHHSGLLTTPVYLLRFQTNRARANRFYDAFLCQPFSPPAGGIPVEDEVAALQPDVQLRPGCNYCHALLEPSAAYWGRWTQQGGGFLAPEDYPEYRPECRDCGRGLEPCSDNCRLHYVTRALSPEEEPNLGRLRAYEFLRAEHRPNVDTGPAALVRQGLADGRFTACTVRRTAEWLLGRELRAEEAAWSRELASTWVGDDLRYRDLVRAVVRSETYRRAL